jgi:hypothetical protein
VHVTIDQIAEVLGEDAARGWTTVSRLRPLLWLAAAVLVAVSAINASHDRFFLRSGTSGAWDLQPWSVAVLAVAGAVPLARQTVLPVLVAAPCER